MRIIFMGTPDFAVPSLRAIRAGGHEVVAVYTQPPRQAGRGLALRPSPVQQKAEREGLSVLAPAGLLAVMAGLLVLSSLHKQLAYDEIFIFRCEDGRIAETWGVVDVISQMKQLGLIPD